MKICIISGALPNVSCGIGDYVDALAQAFVRRGQEVAVLTTAAPELRIPSEYRVVPMATTWSGAELGRIAAAVRMESPDVLNVQYPGVGLGRGFGATFAPLALRLRGPAPVLAITMHEFQTFRLRHRLRLATALSFCDLAIAPDPTVLASIRRLQRWRPGLQTAMIPVASNIFPAQGHRHPVERRRTGELIIGYWGFLRPDKGVDLLLEAFAQIRKTQPAQLVLAGDPGPNTAYAASLWRRAEALGVSADLRVTGKLSIDEISAELLSFDVCVLPFRDGLTQNRTTYAGALAHGLYVVTTSTTNRGFEIERNTAFVPPAEIGPLVSAILEAPLHPRAQRITDCIAAWDEIADAHLAAYETAGSHN